MAHKKETAKVVEQKQLADDIFSMWISAPSIAETACPGQFLSVYSSNAKRLLPRPISICEISSDRTSLRIVYRVTGENTGTYEFSKYTAGNNIDIMGPLGNGFPIERCKEKDVMLVGGGIGVPPMLEVAKCLPQEVIAVLGYKDAHTFLADEFRKNADQVYIASDDGSVGTHGTVIDAIKENNIKSDVIMACGPTPMLKALKDYAHENGIECYISLEEKMACGIGACLACVCRSKEVDEHSNVHNKRICKDGPVFPAEEVEL